MWSESSNEQATFGDVTEITTEILKISLKFAKMDSIFVEARGCDGTNLCFIERRLNFLGSLLISGSKTFSTWKQVKFICQLRILPTRDSCFNQTRANLGAERLCTNGSSEGSGRKPRYMCRVKQLIKWWQCSQLRGWLKTKLTLRPQLTKA